MTASQHAKKTATLRGVLFMNTAMAMPPKAKHKLYIAVRAPRCGSAKTPIGLSTEAMNQWLSSVETAAVEAS